MLSPNQPLQNLNEADDEIDLLALLGTLWRGKIWILAAGLAALIIGAWYVLFAATPMYTASSSVALESREQQVMDIESVVTGLSGDTSTINTEVEVLRSRELIERLVLDLKLQNDPEFNPSLLPEPAFSVGKLVGFIKEAVLGEAEVVEPLEEQRVIDGVVSRVLSQVSISNLRQSYVFTITVQTEEARKSANIANRLAQLYIDDQVRVKFEKTEQVTKWLSERVVDLQISLEDSEERLKTFVSNADLISPEGLIAVNRQLKELRERRALLETSLVAKQEEIAGYKDWLATGDFAAFAAATRDDILNRLLVNGTEEEVQKSRLETRAQTLIARAEGEADRISGQIAALGVSIEEVSDRAARQSDELVKLQQFEREAEASRLIYEAFLSRLKEASVQQGIQQADSRILSEAVIPNDPSSPKKGRVLALSLILGLMVGSGGVLAKEMTQNTYRLAEDLEQKTGYAVIGQIPTIPARRRSNVLKYLTDKPNSAAAEAIRNLRTSLRLANIDHDPKVIMSTSSIPGEGKTTQSISLTQNFAGLGEKVLLVEGDIRKLVFREYFDIKKKHGLLSVVSGDIPLEDAIAYNDTLKADILFGEKSTINAADFFSSAKFGEFIEMLRSKYDRIIIDTPPVLAVPDARVIGQKVDAILYTVRWDYTMKRQVTDGLRTLETVNLRPSGLVLGQIDKRGMKRYGYGDYYGAYHSYYES